MNVTIFDRRRAGLLTPVFALRHAEDLGVGDTHAVKKAIDFAAEQGFSVLQLLPIHETFGDHSPYSPISSRALSPAFLHLRPDEVPGLTEEMLREAAPAQWIEQLRRGNVSYEAVYPLKIQILFAAYHRFSDHEGFAALREEFEAFRRRHSDWLEPYLYYRLLIREYEGDSGWRDWRPEHRSFDSARKWVANHPGRENLEDSLGAFAFIQWVAWRQWKSVRAHAEEKGVRLLGELTFGVALSSSDVWANRDLFDLDWSMGTRPLAHFDTNKDSERWGQNWGLPAYVWECHRATSFAWLRGRVAWAREFYHGCRVDHLRGYFRAYRFPWPGGVKHVEFSHLDEEEAAEITGGLLPGFEPGSDEETPEENERRGREIIGQLIDAAGDMDLVAELMGDRPEYMERTLRDLQLANLSFPQLERAADRSVLPPESFRELSLVAYANHDNAPLASIYRHGRNLLATEPETEKAREFAALLRFAGLDEENPPEELDGESLQAFQAALFRTRARLGVLMCSDLLGLPIRFNLPGSYGKGTWSDRLPMPLEEMLSDELLGPRIRNANRLIRETGRAVGP